MKVKNLTKTYRLGKGRRVEALKGVSFDLPERGMVFILGKSGSGKSTLLQLLGGMDAPDGREILSCGLRLDKATKKQSEAYRRNSCGFVFQEYNLIPELTAGENVELALRLCGEKQTAGRTEEALARVGLEGYAGRKVTELSGGQRQRVAIARAVVKNPGLILADEPTGALDEETGAEIFSLLKSLSDSCLVVTVTHDRASAEKYGDRVIELKEGEIAADNGGGYASDEREEAQKKEGGKLPVKTAVRLGAESFRRHPVRAAVSVLLSAVVFALAGAAVTVRQADPERTAFRLTEEAGVQSAVYKQSRATDAAIRLTGEEADYVGERLETAFPVVLADCEIDNLAREGGSVYNSAMPVGFAGAERGVGGFSVTGRLPQREGEIGITRFLAEIFAENGLTDGEGNVFSGGSEEIVGMPLSVNGEPFAVTAVIDTGFDGDKYAALRETTEGGALAERFFSEISQSAHALLFLPDLSPLADEGEIKAEYALLSFGTYETKVEKIGKEEGQYPVAKAPGSAVGATLPVSFLPQILRALPAEGVYAGAYDTLWEVFSALFASYFSKNAERYYALAVADGYAGTAEEYAASVAAGEQVAFGARLSEMYFDAYAENCAALPLPEKPGCTLTDRMTGREFSFPVSGFYWGENGVLLPPELYGGVYRGIGGVYDFLAVPEAGDGGAALSFLGGEVRDGFVFSMDNYIVRALREESELFALFGRIAGVLSVAFGSFAVLLYLNFVLQNARDRYATIAVLRALGCGREGVFGIFAASGGLFGAGVLCLSFAGLGAAFAAAGSALFAAGLSSFLLPAAGILLLSAVGSAVPVFFAGEKKFLRLMRE